MIAVLDTSAAIEIVLQREYSGIFTPCITSADWVIAPTLYIAEVANVFWKYQKLVDYPFADCEKNIEQAIGLPDDFVNERELYREAFKLACNVDHSVYDMLYLTVARRNNATLLTMDKKLIKTAQKCSVEVIARD